MYLNMTNERIKFPFTKFNGVLKQNAALLWTENQYFCKWALIYVTVAFGEGIKQKLDFVVLLYLYAFSIVNI